MTSPSQIVPLLSQAWRRHEQITETELPPESRPPDAAAGYACQDALLAQLAPEHGAPVGYKIGCTNSAAQQLLGTTGPFYGRLLAQRVHASPARQPAGRFFMRVVEPEFAFKMARDLPSITTPYDRTSVAAAVATVLPAIEIADSRYSNWTKVGAPALIADNGANGAWVYGPDYSGDWRALNLPNHAMTLAVNGQALRQGRGELVMGDPLNALVWLANTLREQGRGLRAGDLISTGVCCEVYRAEANDQLQADFGALGTVELSFN